MLKQILLNHRHATIASINSSKKISDVKYQSLKCYQSQHINMWEDTAIE